MTTTLELPDESVATVLKVLSANEDATEPDGAVYWPEDDADTISEVREQITAQR